MKALLRKRVVKELPHSVCQWFISLKLCETCIPPGLWADLVQSVRHHKNSLKLSGLSPFKNFMKFVLTTRAAEHFFPPTYFHSLALSLGFLVGVIICGPYWFPLRPCASSKVLNPSLYYTLGERRRRGESCAFVFCVWAPVLFVVLFLFVGAKSSDSSTSAAVSKC